MPLKKRFLVLLLALSVLFAASACSGTPEAEGTSSRVLSGAVGDSSGKETQSDRLSTDGGDDVAGTKSDLPALFPEEPLSSSEPSDGDPETDGPSSDGGTQTEDYAGEISSEEDPPETPDFPVYSGTVSSSRPSGTASSGTADSDTSTDGNTPSEPQVPWEPVNKVTDLVMATDQYHQRVVIYDFSLLSEGDSLDKGEIWSCDIGYAAGLKYREDTVFGDVIITAGSSSKIIAYPSGQVIWSTSNSGNNPHSVEILPSGNVVIASSTGGTLRLFDSAQKKQTYRQYSLTGAHGVLWDPEYSLLWALGDYELVCYTVSGSVSSQKLTEKNRYTLPASGGHDLSADFTDTNFLFVSVNSTVYRFDKATGTFASEFDGSDYVGVSAVKGVGNNPNGNYFFCAPNGGIGRVWAGMSIAGWCTDTIHFIRQIDWDDYSVERYSSSSSAFYKVRVFYGKYQ